MQGRPVQQRQAIIRNKRATLQQIIESINIVDWNKPMARWDPELGLANPYSKVSCMILYLYSMELGNPPLYAEANRIARDNDLSLIKELGPFLRGLSVITAEAELNKSKFDKIP